MTKKELSSWLDSLNVFSCQINHPICKIFAFFSCSQARCLQN